MAVMNKFRLLTPGPRPVPEDTLLELARPVFFHRWRQFRELFAEVLEDLNYIFRTKNPVLTLTAPAPAAWKRRSRTVCRRAQGDLLITGRWGERWRNLCKAFGVEAISVTVPYGQAVPPEQLTEGPGRASRRRGRVRDPERDGHRRAQRHRGLWQAGRADAGKLFIVDTISGLGVMECQTDDWSIDICVTGSQKALMLPPGLAFVSVSDKAWAGDRRQPARRDLLLRPAEVPRTPEGKRHAVHAGATR